MGAIAAHLDSHSTCQAAIGMPSRVHTPGSMLWKFVERRRVLRDDKQKTALLMTEQRGRVVTTKASTCSTMMSKKYCRQ